MSRARFLLFRTREVVQLESFMDFVEFFFARLKRLCRRQNQDEVRSVGILSGFFFMINFVVGTGFLSIPYAFYHAGVVSGAITLIFLSFISWNTANWVVETMARAQVSRGRPHGGRPFRSSAYRL